MTCARSLVVIPGASRCYHLTTKCVRGSFLCGDGFEHRKAWIEQRIEHMAEAFGIEVLAYAIMSNHMHLVVRTRPDLPRNGRLMKLRSDGLAVYPKKRADGQRGLPVDEELKNSSLIKHWLETQRERLSDLSWFMKVIKEPIARRANKEEGCTGSFWQGRFHSTALLDQQALTSCMAYVDLNPIRAKICETPEASKHTSIYKRILSKTLKKQMDCCLPIPDCQANLDELSSIPLSFAEYLTLVDESGRIIAAGKRGSIPTKLAPILKRLKLSGNNWLQTLLTPKNFLGTAIGSIKNRIQEAKRRGKKWICNKTTLQHTAEPPITT